MIDDGRIVERGTHAELVAAGGIYARQSELAFFTQPSPLEDRRIAS